MAIKKIYIVPNLVTTGNMFCGYYSIVSAIEGNFERASWFILLAAVFDAMDGRIARLAKATSEFGVQYDSLSDLSSFGMAPSILFFQWSLRDFGRLGIFASFLYVTCAALRLARFNVNVGIVPKGYFQGLPSPAAAGLLATYILFFNALLTGTSNADDFKHFGALVIAVLAAVLMVSMLRFPSFKEVNWRSRGSFGLLLVGVMMIILIAVKPEVTLFLTGALFVVSGLVWNLVRFLKPKQAVANQET